ncbi:MAG: hypothetical protein AABY22_34705 [Nanoarchaeota archaeon]
MSLKSKHNFKAWLYKEFRSTTNFSPDEILNIISEILECSHIEELYDGWWNASNNRFYQSKKYIFKKPDYLKYALKYHKND